MLRTNSSIQDNIENIAKINQGLGTLLNDINQHATLTNKTFYNCANLTVNSIYIELLNKIAGNRFILLNLNDVSYLDENINILSKINDIYHMCNIKLGYKNTYTDYKIDKGVFYYYGKVDDTLIRCPDISVSLLFKYHFIKKILSLERNILEYNDIKVCNDFIKIVDDKIKNNKYNMSTIIFNELNNNNNTVVNENNINNIILQHIYNIYNNTNTYKL